MKSLLLIACCCLLTACGGRQQSASQETIDAYCKIYRDGIDSLRTANGREAALAVYDEVAKAIFSLSTGPEADKVIPYEANNKIAQYQRDFELALQQVLTRNGQ